MSAAQFQVFNPQAAIEVLRLDAHRTCLVMDDALVDPDSALEYAAARRADFRPVGFSGYPGAFLAPPPALADSLYDVFLQRFRRHFDARRTPVWTARYSITTLAPQALRPNQWLCHADNTQLDAQSSLQASVLYLFRDATLGGTSFYVPRRSPAETAALFADSYVLAAPEFTQRYGIAAGYMVGSNEWFECIGSVEARWNRLVMYDGAILHSGDFPPAERLVDDPRSGRLTFNGFFTSRRALA